MNIKDQNIMMMIIVKMAFNSAVALQQNGSSSFINIFVVALEIQAEYMVCAYVCVCV